MYQLKPQDAQFLYMESEDNLTHVTNVAVFDPSTVPGGRTVRLKDIMAHVEERLHYNPLFYRKLMRLPLELDYPYWIEDEHFDLEYHIRHGRLPEPGDWRQFCIHMARYHSRPLDMNRPPWEMFVVEGLDRIDGLPPGSYAIATKIHHSAVDGMSMVRFFTSMADADNRGTPAMPLQPVEIGSGVRPSMRDIARRATVNNIRYPLRLVQSLAKTAPGLYRAVQESRAGSDRPKTHVPYTRFNGAVSPHKMFDARVFPLDDLKTIRTLVPECKINDVVLAICSGALRRYLSYHDELPDQSLVAWVPINARPVQGQSGDAPGNNISAMTAQIHTGEEDPVERLRAIFNSTKASKEARAGMSARLMTDLTQHVPAATQVMAARLVLSAGVAARACNLFVSNVPGPQEELYMCGAKQVGTYGMAPLGDGMGLFIATPSYAGRMTFNVISTRELLPDIEFFMECLEESVAELLALATGKKKPSARKRKSAPRPKRARAKKTSPSSRARKKASA